MEKSYRFKHYKTKACAACCLRSQCTTNKLGRLIERTEYQPYVTGNNNRIKKNPEYYRQRQQIIEHQFGTLKRHWYFDYTHTRGKQKVLGEVYLAFTCYNLKRTLTILGFKDLMARLKAFLLTQSQILALSKTIEPRWRAIKSISAARTLNKSSGLNSIYLMG